ncbi:unnamed protein product, partial [Pylaiella littoralis]
ACSRTSIHAKRGPPRWDQKQQLQLRQYARQQRRKRRLEGCERRSNTRREERCRPLPLPASPWPPPGWLRRPLHRQDAKKKKRDLTTTMTRSR